MLRLLLVLGLAGCGVSAASPATVDQYAAKLAPLIDPAKLKTLGERGANQRVQKAVAILTDARAAGGGSRRGLLRSSQRRWDETGSG